MPRSGGEEGVLRVQFVQFPTPRAAPLRESMRPSGAGWAWARSRKALDQSLPIVGIGLFR
jgi:hypothetical protein